MAGVVAELDQEALNRFFRKKTKNAQDVQDMKKAYVGTIISFIIQDIEDHFQREQGPEGAWPDWSDAYKKHMLKRGKGGNKILQDSGHLKGGVRPSNWRKSRSGLEVFNPAKTKTGFAYAAHHNEGSSTSDGKPRTFMWLSDKGLDKISQATLAYIVGG